MNILVKYEKENLQVLRTHAKCYNIDTFIVPSIKENIERYAIVIKGIKKSEDKKMYNAFIHAYKAHLKALYIYNNQKNNEGKNN